MKWLGSFVQRIQLLEKIKFVTKVLNEKNAINKTAFAWKIARNNRTHQQSQINVSFLLLMLLPGTGSSLNVI